MYGLILLLLCISLAFQLAATIRPNVPKSTPSTSSASPAGIGRFRRQSEDRPDPPQPLDDPQLPQVPPALEGVDSDCLFWQYIQAQPLTQPEVQQQIQELCVNNATSNTDSQNGWCEIDLEVVIKQIGNGSTTGLRMDTDVFDSVKELHIYIRFTDSGLWQVLAIPDCQNNQQDKKRFVRSLFKFQ